MKKFLVTYHAPFSSAQQMADSTPEEMQKGMDEWMAWAKKCGSGLVDMGAPLGNGEQLNADGSSKSHNLTVGYSFLQAENLHGAKKLLEGHPHLGWNKECTIEVREILDPPS
ncbi:MAG: hypothetical protein E4H36_15465 [Spirochaetales bacterium]|nr:MAG: hypothetical protein E4H36_15465 [Spirochaetales bacterium]